MTNLYIYLRYFTEIIKKVAVITWRRGGFMILLILCVCVIVKKSKYK